MTIFDSTIAKLQQLSEPLLQEITDYIDFVIHKQQAQIADIQTNYDIEADVLYINFHQPALVADDSELSEEGILIRYQNDEIIGLTILNVSRNDALSK